METISTLLALYVGNSPVTGEFPPQRPVTRGYDVFFDLCLNKRLSKQSSVWWFETPSCSLWRHCNGLHPKSSRWQPQMKSVTKVSSKCHLCFSHDTLGATARSYRRQDGADAAARSEKFLPAHASLRPPISLKFTTEKHGGMVHPVPKRQTRTLSHFCK